MIEADLLLSDKKLSGIQVASSLVLGVAYVSVPVFLIVVSVYSIGRHKPRDFDPVTTIVLFVGAFVSTVVVEANADLADHRSRPRFRMCKTLHLDTG